MRQAIQAAKPLDGLQYIIEHDASQRADALLVVSNVYSEVLSQTVDESDDVDTNSDPEMQQHNTLPRQRAHLRARGAHWANAPAAIADWRPDGSHAGIPSRGVAGVRIGADDGEIMQLDKGGGDIDDVAGLFD